MNLGLPQGLLSEVVCLKRDSTIALSQLLIFLRINNKTSGRIKFITYFDFDFDLLIINSLSFRNKIFLIAKILVLKNYWYELQSCSVCHNLHILPNIMVI